MAEYIFRLYAATHMCVKKLLRRNVLSVNSKILSVRRYKSGVDGNASALWQCFIDNSLIPDSDQFGGFHYAGYILENSEWCLPSWIWTNAAIVRLFVAQGDISKATILGEKLLAQQQECGGWIVRNDYDSKGPIPVLAPNDSAYIANNAFIPLYEVTGDIRYLQAAKRCADWILATCREDGMVYTGYNTRDKKWSKDNIIVDVGFTAGLFANLYKTTHEHKYKDYLLLFVRQYIKLFYSPSFRGFATSINKVNRQQGGFFGRGQAWALEGLIPAFNVLQGDSFKAVIEQTIESLIEKQNSDGSWAYNLSRPLMGNDCKGVSVIAKSLLEWYKITQDKRLFEAGQKALEWCKLHTVIEGEAHGGIFSFCTEGAIVKDLYSSCAFVYASAYAIELESFIQGT